MIDREWFVGQEVLVRDVNEKRQYWENSEPPTGTITKVGRKLFTVRRGSWDTVFRIETGRTNDAYEHSWVQTKEGYADQERRAELVKDLRGTGLFAGYYPKLKTNTLEAILQVIKTMEGDK